MAVSVAAVMRQIHNYFEVGSISGVIAVSGNAIVPEPESPWCYVSGSWMHDGAWQVKDGKLVGLPDGLPDEEFNGRVWLLKPPADFLALCEEISAYDDKNPAGAYLQESFGGYSYMRRQTTGSTAWQDVYAGRLAPYRRMFTEVGDGF